MKEGIDEKKRIIAYWMGYSKAINGANESNCHFMLFSDPAYTRQWERGRDEGEKDKEAGTIKDIPVFV